MARSRRKRLRREQGYGAMGRRVSGHTWTAGRATVLMCNAQAGNASHVGHRHLWQGINGKLTAQAFAP